MNVPHSRGEVVQELPPSGTRPLLVTGPADYKYRGPGPTSDRKCQFLALADTRVLDTGRGGAEHAAPIRNINSIPG
jgi:hypothetical protein